MRILKSISAQLTLIVLICYLLPATVLGFYMGGTMIRDEQAKTETALLSGMEFSRLLTDQNLSRVVALARAATYDGELDNAIAQRNAGAITDSDFLRAARGYVERKYSREPAVAFAAVFTLDAPQLLLVNRSGTDAANRYQSTAHAQVLRLGETLDTQCRFVEIGGDLYLVRNLMNLRMESYGMLVLGLDRERLLAPLLDLARGWDARLDVRLDDMDAVNLSGVSGMDEAVDWSAIEPGRIAPISVGMYACTQFGDSRDYAMRAGLLLDRRRLYGGIDGFRQLQAGLLILLVPVLGITMWYVHRRISRPIMLLSEASGRIEAGELGVTVPMHGDDELGRLGKAFTSMSLRLEELIDRTYKEQIALRDARIQAMQSRINPHFINNALETINWQARMEDSKAISAMVESLSVLLNAGMSRNNKQVITLPEELETAKAYFYFVGLRFGDRIAFCYKVPGGQWTSITVDAYSNEGIDAYPVFDAPAIKVNATATYSESDLIPLKLFNYRTVPSSVTWYIDGSSYSDSEAKLSAGKHTIRCVAKFPNDIQTITQTLIQEITVQQADYWKR